MIQENKHRIRSFITCPHCWSEFATDQILWVSESPENIGDVRLGEAEQQRFLPTRFNAQGAAIDSAGFVCHRLACPHCHLLIPRQFIEIPPYFVSIVGAPASGKSYFLASMIWKLRDTLAAEFGIAFADAAPEMNVRLHQYEETQFLNTESNQLVALEKTEVYGSWYNSVTFNDQRISYPQPYVFSLVPMAKHPNAKDTLNHSHLLSLYDNAGESYLPGADSGIHPVTRHLSQSHSIFFLFDPTQSLKFRAACRTQSRDPQLFDAPEESIPEERAPDQLTLEKTLNKTPKQSRALVRQDTILVEMIKRVRQHTGLSSNERHKKPLYVIVTKLDAWSHLLPKADWTPPWKRVHSRNPGNLVSQPKEPPTPDSGSDSQEHSFVDELDDFFGRGPTRNRTPAPAENGEESVKQQRYRSSLAGFSTQKVEEMSNQVRSLLLQYAPEIVMNAEQFAEEVRYIPTSATGCAPTPDPKSGMLGFYPKDISPIWVEVPLLYALAKTTRGVVPVLQPKK